MIRAVSHSRSERAGSALAAPLPSEVVGGKPRRLESSSDLATCGLRCRSCTARSMLQPEVTRRCAAIDRDAAVMGSGLVDALAAGMGGRSTVLNVQLDRLGTRAPKRARYAADVAAAHDRAARMQSCRAEVGRAGAGNAARGRPVATGDRAARARVGHARHVARELGVACCYVRMCAFWGGLTCMMGPCEAHHMKYVPVLSPRGVCR